VHPVLRRDSKKRCDQIYIFTVNTRVQLGKRTIVSAVVTATNNAIFNHERGRFILNGKTIIPLERKLIQ